ncbi:hypothetical protein CQW23_02566 [Capsicum baccatum]|uniref:Uncharacterized protein n=1 Tax=Capsicum baccatum TaxID=33114 RepID=A0A2G2XRT6_CAPBA|nr:hypothetical protein CQW23_02566 [Capsicum baccatum]
MDIEALFMNSFSIEKKPSDICKLIERAVVVAKLKYPAQLEKCKNRLIKMMLNPSRFDCDDEEEEEEDETSNLDEEESTNAEQKEEHEEEETQQITAPTNQKPSLKIKLTIKRSAHVDPLEKHNNSNAIEELKKRSETDLVEKQLDAEKEGTRQLSTKPTQVAPPRLKLLSDLSFENHLDGDKKQSYKGFKKMDSLTENEREEQKVGTSGLGLAKNMPPPLMKMNNVAAKRVQVAPHQKQVISDYSAQKQNNCSSITRPIQKEAEGISYMAKFESSKRKYEERLAEEREAKRRIVMVDFNRMPKPANGSRAPRRRWWESKRS